MSFIGKENKGVTYAPGYFLSSEECTRKTMQMTTTMVSAQVSMSTTLKALAIDKKFVPGGIIYPTNDGNAEGIVYEDVDISSGAMPGSVVTKGQVYEDRLPVDLESAAKTALEGKGFTFTANAPAVTRPY